MIESKPYTISRLMHARLTGLYYLRTFWFVLVPPFVFGVALVIFGPNKVSQVFGLVLAIWPMTVFARAYLLHRRVHEAWLEPTVLKVGEDAFLFENQGSNRTAQLKFTSIRKVVRMFGYQLLQTLKYGFVAVPDDALPPGTNLESFLRKSV
jgi:hypothetical protein